MEFNSRRLLQLNAYDRHKVLVNQYLLNRPGSKIERDTSRDKRDIDVIRENHRFLWSETESSSSHSWGEQLAKKYYDKLFKEYCICDLSRYKENKVALRWQVEEELVSGKGQFECGNKVCSAVEGLRTWEVNFAYLERGEKKNALVKLRLCPPCSDRLNHHHKKREVRRRKRGGSEATSKPKRSRLDQSPVKDSEPGQSESSSEVADQSQASVEVEQDDGKVWRETSTNQSEEKSRDDEFQEYFDDLFL